MKIHYLSDLHIEFWQNMLDLPGGEVLLLAGDMMEVARVIRRGEESVFHLFAKEQLSKYKQVYYIMGNHEHYNGDINTTFANLKSVIVQRYPNISLLQNEIVELNDKWMLYAGTLWTDYMGGDIHAMTIAGRSMNDHYVITNGRVTFRPTDALVLNNTTRADLHRILADEYKDRKWIVMTHHTPSMRSCSAKWKGQVLNYAFHNTGLDDFIKSNKQIKFWVNGHTHDTTDYKIGSCRVLCNPKGYRNENPQFDPTKYFQIK